MCNRQMSPVNQERSVDQSVFRSMYAGRSNNECGMSDLKDTEGDEPHVSLPVMRWSLAEFRQEICQHHSCRTVCIRLCCATGMLIGDNRL